MGPLLRSLSCFWVDLGRFEEEEPCSLAWTTWFLSLEAVTYWAYTITATHHNRHSYARLKTICVTVVHLQSWFCLCLCLSNSDSSLLLTCNLDYVCVCAWTAATALPCLPQAAGSDPECKALNTAAQAVPVRDTQCIHIIVHVLAGKLKKVAQGPTCYRMACYRGHCYRQAGQLLKL